MSAPGKALFASGHIAVIGAGPVGCTVAASLAGAGHQVILCDVLEELLATACDPGIRVEGVLERQGRVAGTTLSLDELADDPPELIIVTTKATALPLIASAIQGFHRPGTYVVSWQNGLDTERALTEHIGAQWVMRAAVNFGVSLVGPGHVHVAFHHPPHWLQELHEDGRPAAAALCELLTGSGLPTSHATRIADRIWQKTILNASLSPVCAVAGVTMAQALRDPYLKEMVGELLKEGIRVARANEIHLGWDFYRHSLDYLQGAGDHKPSMLVDIENRRITEVEYINGKIAQYADFAGVQAPNNKMIRGLVKALEP